MRYLLIFAVICAVSSCKSQKLEQQNESKDYQIAFYNVENLFDTINEPRKRDGEYTPTGSKEWDTEKYYQKLDRIAQVIASIDSAGPIAAIGLAEVENRRVLEDLIVQKRIKSLNLQILHKESPDGRGIDVALLYNPKLINPYHTSFIEVNIGEEERPTRDILRADMMDHTRDSLIIYVNHWPSRWGGKEKSEPKRIKAATELRDNIGSLPIQSTNILVLGDLNDYPTNKSVKEVLNADSAVVNDGRLFNATYDIHIDSTQGTHAYRGNWGVLDHAILSPTLMKSVKTVYVHKKPYMLYETKKGKKFPSRTHSGKRYFAGYSDHLPIVVEFK